ncbi:alpha/beta fold hydrolase [Jatrophihabitans lederbergiae]|uniref:alpha/beta fold hydrolase n=1 Tax=Jatrophihabitans lederbergiae TaxID=3075547 RepID=UPI0037BE3F1D
MVGSSGGGAVALQVASTVPERLSALVLLCAAAEGVEPTLLASPARPPSSPETATCRGPAISPTSSARPRRRS